MINLNCKLCDLWNSDKYFLLNKKITDTYGLIRFDFIIPHYELLIPLCEEDNVCFSYKKELSGKYFSIYL